MTHATDPKSLGPSLSRSLERTGPQAGHLRRPDASRTLPITSHPRPSLATIIEQGPALGAREGTPSARIQASTNCEETSVNSCRTVSAAPKATPSSKIPTLTKLPVKRATTPAKLKLRTGLKCSVSELERKPPSSSPPKTPLPSRVMRKVGGSIYRVSAVKEQSRIPVLKYKKESPKDTEDGPGEQSREELQKNTDEDEDVEELETIKTHDTTQQGKPSSSNPETTDFPEELALTKAPRVSQLRIIFLKALGYYDPVFRGEGEFLRDVPTLLQRLESKNLDWIAECDLVEIKVRELHERIRIIKSLICTATLEGAGESEIGCTRGWEEDLCAELARVQCKILKPHKSWVRHIIEWLWDLEVEPGMDLTELGTSFIKHNGASEKHELFNLEGTSVELAREGFDHNENKIVSLWADIRSVHFVVNASAKAILDEYIRRLTRWDGVALGRDAVQERRMFYFCMKHYIHWKEAISHYSLSLKMVNLLIVFHDLWGMHVDGMTVQEKQDFGALHDNLYEFACIFQRPIKKGEDNVWNGVECHYCFYQTVTDVLPEDRNKSLWLWLMQIAAIAGYGKYHAALLRMMTEGKSSEYCNKLLDNAYWKRQASMLYGLARINVMIRKNAREGALIRPVGTIHHKANTKASA